MKLKQNNNYTQSTEGLKFVFKRALFLFSIDFNYFIRFNRRIDKLMAVEHDNCGWHNNNSHVNCFFSQVEFEQIDFV